MLAAHMDGGLAENFAEAIAGPRDGRILSGGAQYPSRHAGRPAEALADTDCRDRVIERFANPFLRHHLADIAQNHVSKKQHRIAPLLALAAAAGLPQATHLTATMASDVG